MASTKWTTKSLQLSNEDNKIPSRRLFVSDIDRNVTKADLKSIFDQYGEITTIEIDEKGETAFLTYSTREETLTALLNKDNLCSKGRLLKICEATPKKTQLFVGGLKSEITNQDLHDKFSEFGQVYEANVKVDPRTGYSRCFGFVTFVDCDHVCKNLIERRFMEFAGKTIEIKRATPITDYFRQIKEKSTRPRQTSQIPSQNMQQPNMIQFANPMYQLNQQMMQMSMNNMMQGGPGFMIPIMNPMMPMMQPVQVPHMQQMEGQQQMMMQMPHMMQQMPHMHPNQHEGSMTHLSQNSVLTQPMQFPMNNSSSQQSSNDNDQVPMAPGYSVFLQGTNHRSALDSSDNPSDDYIDPFFHKSF